MYDQVCDAKKTKKQHTSVLADATLGVEVAKDESRSKLGVIKLVELGIVYDELGGVILVQDKFEEVVEDEFVAELGIELGVGEVDVEPLNGGAVGNGESASRSVKMLLIISSSAFCRASFL